MATRRIGWGGARDLSKMFGPLSLRAAIVLGALLFHIFVSQVLPLAEAGLVFLLIVWIAGLSIVVRWGLDNYLLVVYAGLGDQNFTSDHRLLLLRLYAVVGFLGFIGSLVVFSGLWASGPRNAQIAVEPSILFFSSLAVVPYSLALVNGALHKSLGQYWTANGIEAGGGSVLALAFTGIFFCLHGRIGVADVLVCVGIGYWVLWVLSCLSLVWKISRWADLGPERTKKTSTVIDSRNLPSVLTVLRESRAFVGTAAITYLLLWLPGVAMGWAGRLEDVSVFNAIVRTGSLIVFGLSVANVFAAPRIAALYRVQNFEQMQQLAWRVASASFGFGAMVMFAVLVFGQNIMNVFGEDYSSAKIPLGIYAAGQLVSAFTGSSTYLLQLTGSAGTSLRILLLIFLSVGLGGAAAAAAWGVWAAVTASAIAVGLYNLGTRKVVKERFMMESNPRWYSDLVRVFQGA